MSGRGPLDEGVLAPILTGVFVVAVVTVAVIWYLVAR